MERAYGIVGITGISGSTVRYSPEKNHRAPELEIVLDVLITGAVHLNAQLVETVIIALTGFQGEPGISTLHLPLHPDGLGELAEILLFAVVFNLQQHALLLKDENGGCTVPSFLHRVQ